MKIVVQCEDGTQSVLRLIGQWTVIEGVELDRLVSNGVEYYFTKDGFYDGWSGYVSALSAIDGVGAPSKPEQEKAT